MRRRTILTITIASVAVGCGLVSGLDGLKVTDSDASPNEAGGDDVVLVQCDGGCGFALPSGFTLVTFTTAPPTTCPNGTTPQAVAADPTVANDACTCKCTMTTKATCAAVDMKLFVNDGGFTCGALAGTLTGGAGCHQTTLTLASNARVTANFEGVTVLDAGACGTKEVADASTLVATTAQVCIPTSCAATETLCTPPPGQRLCVASAGDVACPAPFTEKHSIGSDAGVACSTCASTCTANAPNCSFSNSLTLYTDMACSAGSQSTSNCAFIAGAPTFKSYDYNMIAGGGCTTTATSTASASLAGQQTVCCQPGN